MGQASVTQTIDAQADAVWNTVRSFGDMDKMLPELIAECEVTGSGEGATRVCTMKDGAKLSERLEKLDESGRALTYSVADGVLPMTGYSATVRVSDAGAGRTEVNWSATFTPAGASEQEVVGMLEGVYQAGIQQMQSMSTATA